jgi:hypothetical protein
VRKGVDNVEVQYQVTGKVAALVVEISVSSL